MGFLLIATHKNPDLDAVASVWLLKRFDKANFGEAEAFFVEAGQVVSAKELERLGLNREQVEHVDTGLGRFDHHTEELALKKVCAASLVRDYLVEIYPDLEQDEALARMVDFFVEIDHFGEIDWPDPNNTRYLFMLDEIMKNLKTIGGEDSDVVEFGAKCLDSVYAGMKVRIAAEEEVRDKGWEFKTKWGKGMAVETVNDEVIKYSQKEGYVVAVKKDPEYGNIRIKAIPNKNIDLTAVYEKILVKDPKASWYFHPAKTMLINGSRKAKHKVASRLSLHETVELIKEV